MKSHSSLPNKFILEISNREKKFFFPRSLLTTRNDCRVVGKDFNWTTKRKFSTIYYRFNDLETDNEDVRRTRLDKIFKIYINK